MKKILWHILSSRALHPMMCVIVISLLGGLLFLLRENRKDVPNPPYLGVASQRLRIDALIDVLRAESLDETAANLVSDTYSYPGHTTALKYPLNDIETMLSSRRSVKYINDIEHLDSLKRFTRLKNDLIIICDMHYKAIETGLMHSLDPTLPSNNQSLQATKLSMCTVLYACATHCDSENLLSLLNTYNHLKSRIDTLLLKNQGKFPDLMYTVIANYTTLDSKFVLNILREASKSLPSEKYKKIAVFTSGFTCEPIIIVNWDAHTTSFDIPHRLEGIAIDLSKGYKTINLYSWPERYTSDINIQSEHNKAFCIELQQLASPR